VGLAKEHHGLRKIAVLASFLERYEHRSVGISVLQWTWLALCSIADEHSKWCKRTMLIVS